MPENVDRDGTMYGLGHKLIKDYRPETSEGGNNRKRSEVESKRLIDARRREILGRNAMQQRVLVVGQRERERALNANKRI